MKTLVAPLLAALLIGATNDKLTDEQPRLTFKGLGSIRIGMTPDEVKNLGFGLTTSGPWGEIGGDDFVSCHYLDSAPDYPGIALMMNDNRLVRIDIGFRDTKGWQSLSGAKTGMSEAEVSAIYGDWLKKSGHPYLDQAGSYLSLTSSDGKYAMIFETAIKDTNSATMDGKYQPKYITEFRAGLSGPVGYIEGCA